MAGGVCPPCVSHPGSPWVTHPPCHAALGAGHRGDAARLPAVDQPAPQGQDVQAEVREGQTFPRRAAVPQLRHPRTFALPHRTLQAGHARGGRGRALRACAALRTARLRPMRNTRPRLSRNERCDQHDSTVPSTNEAHAHTAPGSPALSVATRVRPSCGTLYRSPLLPSPPPPPPPRPPLQVSGLPEERDSCGAAGRVRWLHPQQQRARHGRHPRRRAASPVFVAAWGHVYRVVVHDTS